MLVLSRKPRELVVFEVKGVRFSMQVIEQKGSRTKFGFDAPEEVRIVRGELCGEGEGDGNGNDE